MKKFLCIFFIAVFFCTCAFSDGINYSSMSFDELLLLQKQLTSEIMSRPEWKEVKVPAGSWKIGEDIPAGEYSISTELPALTVTVYKGDSKANAIIISFNAVSKDEPIGKIILSEGCFIDLLGTVTFAPPLSLEF